MKRIDSYPWFERGIILASLMMVSLSVPALELVNTLFSPMRIAEGQDGRLFVTDSKSNSVFILKNLLTEGELIGLDRPLGIAVDPLGNMYVGNDGRDNVEVYDPSGTKLRDIGTGQIQKPNDLALDLAGNLYVADSLANAVKVYAPNGQLLSTIGDTLLQFPVSVTVAYSAAGGGAGELYVADQGNAKIQVFSLSGVLLRAYGEKLTMESVGWQGKFVQLQSLAVDSMGRVHVLDSSLSRVQILDAVTGAYIDTYGGLGYTEGKLNLPLDIMITENDQVMVTNNGNHRIDMILDMN
ncbi:MAG: NHL repeat-containing protein [Candidatus Thiodiazotropha sp. (ex Epidulcina cf. delphinae)]|nr:NHL repeat-containing protein [Candidatus Thiodiazotropha sp. (ex Epidulcina cf. delphinae)]